MMKRVLIIIFSVIVGVSFNIAIIILMGSAFPTNKNNPIIEIHNLLSTKDTHNNIVFVYDDSLFYSNTTFTTKNNILWIDDKNIIYTEDNIRYKLITSDDNELILNQNTDLLFDRYSLIYDSSILYYTYNNKFYSYDPQKIEITEINKKTYYSIKNGNNYNVEVANNSIAVTKSDNTDRKIIDIETIISKNLGELSKWNIKYNNYSIYQDKLFLVFDIEYYEVVVLYNLDNDEVEIYDWGYKKYKNNNNFRCFYVNEFIGVFLSKAITKFKN